MRPRASRESVERLANKIGYKVDRKGTRIHLIKDEETVVKKGYRKAYEFLYGRVKRNKQI